MKVKDLSINVTPSATAKQDGLDNAKVYVDGAQVGSTKDLAIADAYVTTWGFGSSFVVKAGTTAKVKVLADIKSSTSTSYASGDTIIVAIKTLASDIQKMSSLGYQAAIDAVNGTAAALTITSAALTVSKFSGYGNQTVIAGANDVKMGAFVITAGTSEGVSLSSITVNLATYEATTVTNMYLKNHATGVIIGAAKNVPGTSNIYSLSPNITLAANGSLSVDLYANIKSDAVAHAWAAQVDADGSGVITGSSVSATGDGTIIQTMTVATAGTLTTTNGSMPDAAIVLAGSTGNYMAQYTFSASNEGFTIDALKLKVAKAFATSTAGVTIKYKNAAGVLQQASDQFIADDAIANATATFTGLTMYVPANGDVSLDVYVDMASLSSSGASGATGAVILDNNEGFSATGDSGTSQEFAGALVTSADLTGNSFYNRKTKPTFAKIDLGTAPDPVAGALFKFSVIADSAGTVEIKQLGFTITTTTANVTDLYLYDPSASTRITTTDVSTLASPIGSWRLIVGRASAASGPGDASDDNILSIGSSAKTYEVRGTVTGYVVATAITVRFKQDTAATTTSAVSTMISQGAYNIWSDRSKSAHTTVTADWTNGYLLKDMTQAQTFSK